MHRIHGMCSCWFSIKKNMHGTLAKWLERDWLQLIKLDWASIHLATADKAAVQFAPCSKVTPDVEALLVKYSSVFWDGLGEMNILTATSYVKEGTRQILQDQASSLHVEGGHWKRSQQAGTNRKVARRKWAAPVVPAPKGDGHICLCGDSKVTINPELEIDKYLLLKPKDLLATSTGVKVFSKINLIHAYQQMKLAPKCQQPVTVNTHVHVHVYIKGYTMVSLWSGFSASPRPEDDA